MEVPEVDHTEGTDGGADAGNYQEGDVFDAVNNYCCGFRACVACRRSSEGGQRCIGSGEDDEACQQDPCLLGGLVMVSKLIMRSNIKF